MSELWLEGRRPATPVSFALQLMLVCSDPLREPFSMSCLSCAYPLSPAFKLYLLYYEMCIRYYSLHILLQLSRILLLTKKLVILMMLQLLIDD